MSDKRGECGITINKNQLAESLQLTGGVVWNSDALTSLNPRTVMLQRMVETLNEAQQKVVGHANYLHWPLLFAADPETTDIECFMQGDSPTTNLLGVLNGALAFTDSEGIRHRISYSSDDARYTVASTLENTGT